MMPRSYPASSTLSHNLQDQQTDHVSLVVAAKDSVRDSGSIFLYSSQIDLGVYVRIRKTFLEFDFSASDFDESSVLLRKRSHSCDARLASSSSSSRVQVLPKGAENEHHFSRSNFFKSGSSTFRRSEGFSSSAQQGCSMLGSSSPSEGCAFGELQTSEQVEPCHDNGMESLMCKTDSEVLWHTEAPYLALMIRGLPCSLTQQDMLNILDSIGLQTKYNFFYLPKAGNSVSNLGYAFVNFVDANSANRCISALQGVMLSERSEKVCKITVANMQGLPKLRAHFRRSTARRASKPIFFASHE
jgi:hypothetical protein